ncbi:MAG TPA: ATP-binding protein [Gemmatimonadaceae bacterium]|nr:ATP-binding protein [Gemmatimonadaceae bacterium]
MTVRIQRICVTGPESTGKTTLARQLAELTRAEWIPEASRLYAERVDRELLASDVSPIAREHLALADPAAERARAGGGSLVLDTDLVSTVLYARHYYNFVPPWIERAEHARRADLYLLCDVDVPWVADGVRDRPSDREAMFDRFRRALARRRANVIVVRGDWDARWALARDAVASIVTRVGGT